MPTASSQSRGSHARIYSSWLKLPAWTSMSLKSRCLLVEMLGAYRPGDNGNLCWPVRKAASILRIGKSAAGRALSELEANGWISVTRVAAFGGAPRAALYRLTMFRDDVTGDLPSNDFLRSYGYSVDKGRRRDRKSRYEDNAGAPSGHNDAAGEPPQPRSDDKPVVARLSLHRSHASRSA
jgi:hypothetical protein